MGGGYANSRIRDCRPVLPGPEPGSTDGGRRSVQRRRRAPVKARAANPGPGDTQVIVESVKLGVPNRRAGSAEISEIGEAGGSYIDARPGLRLADCRHEQENHEEKDAHGAPPVRSIDTSGERASSSQF